LAHELRNPLAPISAAADLLAAARLDEDKIRRTSAVIQRQVAHMTALVDDLLDISRVTRGLITLEQREIDVHDVIADAEEQARPLMEKRQHALRCICRAGKAYVRGDRKRLVQVLANLLNNAAKYTPPGGAIDMRVEVRERDVAISVSDNGIGMAHELVGRVFDLFAQGERDADRTQGGLG
ncbi:MAG TPA: hybrid sensor histidine kinase/response regulator, partial [Massilia timonae]|nr:hybrid sensor histidine kinase/response regulator [Massilia timonae]